MPTWNKRYIDLKVEEMTKQNVYIVGQGNVDRTNKGKADGKITIYPYTIVNLLGKYGDFEIDSNSDGLADGWVRSSGSSCSFVTGLIGDNAQKLTYDNTSSDSKAWGTLENTTYIPVSEGDILFLSTYAKMESEHTGTNGVQLSLNNFDASKTHISFSVFSQQASGTSWQRLYTTYTIPTGVSYVKARTNLTLNAGEYGSYAIDGYMFANLTAMGALPYGLQQYFGVQKWEDLDDDTLAELLPYVNGVATLGFAWEGI